MDYKVLFAANVRRQRNKLGLTQEQLAEKVGISPNYLSKVERSVSSPTLDVIIKLAEGLEITPTDLFNPTDFSSAVYIYTDLEK